MRTREFTTTITQRGQVTIPAEVRRLLGVGPRDKVTFKVEDGEVRLGRPAYTLESVFGSVKLRKRPDDIDELIRIAKDEKAERTVREMREA